MKEIEEFDWNEFINLGRNYLKRKSPARLRTGISRFYYGTFCSSKDFINKNKTYLGDESKKIMTSKNVDVHKETSRIFKYHNSYKKEEKGKIISKNLNKLRKMRNKADYDKKIYKSLNEMINEAKILSERIFELLEELN